MSNNILTTNGYKKLTNDIVNLINKSKQELEEAIRNQLVLTYWQIGQRIKEENLTNNANYFSLILEDLSKEIGIDKATLMRSVQFFISYPDKPETSNLTWSHYKNLLAIKNDDLRIKLEQRSKEENLSVIALTNLIAQTKANNNKIILNNSKTIKRPTNPNYLYKAKIVNVIDGDTLLLNIDLGFQVIKEQRVRLSQIDAPKKKTKEGEKSFKYLRDLSAKLNQIIVKTNKIDIYGRYLGDIFYPITEANNRTTQTEIFTNGIYLNEELVTKGMARVV